MSNQLDQLRRLADDLAAHRCSRRAFVRRATVLGVSAPMITALLNVIGVGADDTAAKVVPVRAQGENKLVVSSWGGNFGEAQRAAQFEPFTKETGIEIILAPQQPELPLIEAQVTSGKVEWDLAENSNLGAYTLAGKGMLEAIAYDKMDSAIVDGLDPAVKGEHSVGIFFWSIVLGYGKDYFAEGQYPASWGDFADTEKFDAPRGLTEMNFEPPPLEVAMLAKGVEPAALYPLDIEAAFANLGELKPHITKWLGIGADGTQLLVQGELGMADSGNGSLTNAIKDGAPIGMEWNQGLLYFDAWVMPKGAPHPENALRFIEFCSRPDIQAAFVEAYPVGAVVAKAYETIPAEVAASSAGAPDILAKQIKVDSAWWATVGEGGKTNLELVYDTWAAWILG